MKNINRILLLYIILAIIDELISFIILFKSIIGAKSVMIVKNKYIIKNPANKP